MSQSINSNLNDENLLQRESITHSRSRVRTRSASNAEHDIALTKNQNEEHDNTSNNNIDNNNSNINNSSSQTWQYPSSSRCITCGRLGCTSCGVKIDPAIKRQKLESLRLNTPFERAKMMRYYEEVRTDEVKRRRRLIEMWQCGLSEITSLFECELLLLHVACNEQEERAQYLHVESAARARFTAQADFSLLCVGLLTHEREARHALQAAMLASRQELYQMERSWLALLQLLRREVCTREAIQFNETAERERVKTNEVYELQQCYYFDEERRELMSEFVCGLHHWYNTWSVEQEGIIAEAKEEVCLIDQMMRERVSLNEGWLESAYMIIKDEEEEWRQLFEQHRHAHDWMRERNRLFSEHCVALDRMEHVGRLNLLMEQDRELHQLVILCEDAQEELDAWVELQMTERKEFVHQAEIFLLHIVEEAQQSWEELNTAEVQERNAREAWMLLQAKTRSEFINACYTSKREMIEEEERERHALCKRRQESELTATERMVIRERLIHDLWECVSSEVHDLYKAEHNARFTLYGLMAEHEERVMRWSASKSEQVQELFHCESHARNELMTLEADAWSTIMVHCNSDLEQRRLHALAITERLHELVAACERVRHQLMNEVEPQERFTLEILFQNERAQIARTVCYRQVIELQEAEVQKRLLYQRMEMQEFAAVQTQRSLWLRCLCTERQSILHVQLNQVEVDEWQHRTLLIEEYTIAHESWEQEWNRLCERVALLQEESHRAQLRARQEHMREDARIYCDNDGNDNDDEECELLLPQALVCHTERNVQERVTNAAEREIGNSLMKNNIGSSSNSSSSSEAMPMQRMHDNENALCTELIWQTLAPFVPLNMRETINISNNNNNNESVLTSTSSLTTSTTSIDSSLLLATIPSDTRTLVLRILEQINERVAISQNALERAKQQADEGARRVRQQEGKLDSEKEKKEQYVRNRKRQAEERAVRVQNDLTEKQQGEQQIAIERKRLAKLQSTLKQKTAQLEALKRNIHQQYKR